MLAGLRFALRQLLRNRGFALAGIAPPTLGIGGAGAVFGAVNGVLWSPYPNRLAKPGISVMQGPSLDGGVIWNDWTMTARSGGFAGPVRTGKLSPDSLEFFGAPAPLGRTFSGDAFKLAGEPALAILALVHAGLTAIFIPARRAAPADPLDVCATV